MPKIESGQVKKNNPLQKKKVFIIAEAGVNHNGDIELAKQLIDAAAEAKADAVKFQTWKPGEVTGKYATKVAYLEESCKEETRHDLSNRLCLPYDAFRELKAHCEKAGILFLSTPDGFESLDFVVDELDMPIIKIGSTEVTHHAFLAAVAKKGRPIIFSTGLSTLTEVEASINVIRCHYQGELIVLQCTSEYPAPAEDVNLLAMVTMRDAFGVSVGLSDHSEGNEAAIAAVALGARVIEKHFTLDRSLPGPDHQASLTPSELAAFVQAVRKTELLLGDGEKAPSAREILNLDGIRRGVVAAHPLTQGTMLTASDLVAKRPFVGIEPHEQEQLIGRVITRDIDEDEPIRWRDIQ